ncbi:MAG: PDZ domain-containing protein, partial [Candidatus Latescibacteria bacterium]|nr:PDZ domain-containing protein [bacterium]MBD3423690.1 PDZ domain-containing protein [Candidatus Latescibacterota bacterium]
GKHLGRSIGDMFQSYQWKLNGLEVVDINDDLAEYFDVSKGEGVLVTGVCKDSMAGEIGIRSGDVIIEVDGEKIESVDDMNDALEECEDEYRIVVVRKGGRKEFKVDPDDYEMDYHIYGLPEKKDIRIKVPRKDIVDIERMKFAREFEHELQKELTELKEKLKELKERLEKIEEERD